MNALKLILSVLFILAVPLVAANQLNENGTTVPVVIEKAEFDDTDIFPFGVNKIDVERDEELELRLELFAFQDTRDVEVRAFISGYEFNDVKPISATEGPFDVDANVTYVKRLNLRLPSDLDRDDYKLRIELNDRNRFSQVYNYDIQVSAPRHSLTIEDVTLNPGNTVKAGSSLLARVRLENQGQNRERDVKVTLTVPGLNIAASDHIEEIDDDEEEETEEMLLRLPRCANPGVYDTNLEVLYNKGHDRVSGTTKITVLENEACKEQVTVVQTAPQPQEPQTNATDKIRLALEIALGVLIVLLVIIALVGFARMREE